MGIALGIISGSLLKIISRNNDFNQQVTNKVERKRNINKYFPKRRALKKSILRENIKPMKEIKILSNKWEDLASNHSDLETSAYILFEDGRYAGFQENKPLPAASSIKVSILFLTLQLMDQGILNWDDLLELNKDSIAGGAGWMRYQKIGKKFPLHEITTEMIRISDNTATNLLIQKIGGVEVINDRLKELGLKQTELKNLLPDLEGTNTTSAKDLAYILQLADNGKILSLRSRDIFREVMSTSVTNKLIPDGLLKGLGISHGNSDYKLLIEGFRVYNKTGDIGITYADTALLEMPDASRATVGFIVKGPFNDQRSTNLIRNMSASIIPHINPSEAPINQ